MIGAKLAASLAQDPPAGARPADPGRRGRAEGAGGAVPGRRRRRSTSPTPPRSRARIAERPDVIFHLSAIVSGEAEADLEKGYAVNFDGTRNILEAIRALGRLPPAADLRLLDRGLRRALPRDDPGRVLPDAADELRHAEGDGRADAERLLAARHPRRHRHPAADDLHPAGRAEQGGLGLLLQHPARAARRQGGGAAGRRQRAPLARQPAGGDRLLPPRADARHRAARRPPLPDDAGRLGDRRRARSRRCAAPPATRRWR